MSWTRDFIFKDGKIVVRKTGVILAMDQALLSEVCAWIAWFPVLGIAALVARCSGHPPLRVWFAPDRPRPWYLIRGAAIWSNIRLAHGPQDADAAFYFDDSTQGRPPMAGAVNGRCTDISKGHVARVFALVFGYPLEIDPRTAVGLLVEKPEKNGVHAGRVLTAPAAPRDGFVYQRLVDTADADGCCHDLRTVCIGGRPTLVWEKIKPPSGRFAIHNQSAVLRDPSQVFSAGELELIGRFAAEMGLDCGGMDILRDVSSGRVYIVDVNKTDVGPVIALSLRDKIRSMARLAGALRAMISHDSLASPLAHRPVATMLAGFVLLAGGLAGHAHAGTPVPDEIERAHPAYSFFSSTTNLRSSRSGMPKRSSP